MSLLSRCRAVVAAIRQGAKGAPVAVRVIAALALLKGALFLVCGLVLGRFIDHEGAALVMGVAHLLHIQPEGQPVVHLLHLLSDTDLKRLQLLDLVCFAYTALYLIQAFGLWLDRWWAEWLTTIMAGLLVPFEVLELARHPGVPVAVGLALNLGVVGYLIHRLRRKWQLKKQALAAVQPPPSAPPAREGAPAVPVPPG